MDINKPFDLYDIFINELIGDINLTIILGLIILIIISIKSKIPWQVTLLLCLLWILCIFAQTKILLLLISVVTISGLLFYFQIAKAIKR